MKNFMLLLLFLLLMQLVQAQKRGEELIDSLLKELPVAKADSQRAKILIGISKEYWFLDPQLALDYGRQALSAALKSGDFNLQGRSFSLIGTAFNFLGQFDSSLFFQKQSLERYRRINNLTGVASTFNNIGIIFIDRGMTDSAITYYRQSLSIREEMNDSFGISASLLNIGNAYYEKGQLDTALMLFQESYELKKAIRDISNMTLSLLNIGNVHYQQGNFEEAIKAYYEGLKICEEQDDIITQAKLLDNIGSMYVEMKQFDKALTWYEKQLEITTSIQDSLSIARSLSSLGQVYYKKGELDKALDYSLQGYAIYESFGAGLQMADLLYQLSVIYEEKKMYNLALNYCRKALYSEFLAGDQYGLSNIYIQLGRIFLTTSASDSALHYLLKGYELCKSIGSKEQERAATELISRVYRKQGDYKKSLEYYMLFTEVKDSMLNESTVKTIQELNTRYDTEKKEREIALLNMNREIQQAEIGRQKLLRNSFIGGFAVMLLFAGVFFSQRNKIKKGKKRSDELLLNILPAETAEELKITGTTEAKSFDEVTVMFTDFKNFTQVSEQLNPSELVKKIHYCYSAFDKIISKHNLEKIKTIGDSYMCAGGLPVPNRTNAIDSVKAALEICAFMDAERTLHEATGTPFFEIRIGVHTGPVVAGIVGIKKFAYDIWGDTVNIASRMESSGEAGKVNVSSSTYELVKDHFSCRHRGKIQAKNKGEIDMYFVER